VVFDYATAAPYVKVDMNPVIMGENAPFVYKDAIFFSGHKFVGGVGKTDGCIMRRMISMIFNAVDRPLRQLGCPCVQTEYPSQSGGLPHRTWRRDRIFCIRLPPPVSFSYRWLPF
jgi:hypothetical protein